MSSVAELEIGAICRGASVHQRQVLLDGRRPLHDGLLLGNGETAPAGDRHRRGCPGAEGVRRHPVILNHLKSDQEVSEL